MIKDNIKDKTLLILNEEGMLTFIFSNEVYSQIRSLNFNTSSKLLNIILKNNNKLNILLRTEILILRNNLTYINFTSINNVKYNKEYISIDMFDYDQCNEEENNIKDYIRNNYSEKFLYGNMKKIKTSNIKSFFDLIEII